MEAIDNQEMITSAQQISCGSKVPSKYKISCSSQGFISNQQPVVYFESTSNSDFQGSISNKQTIELPYHDNESFTFYLKYSKNTTDIENVVSDFIVKMNGNEVIYASELYYNDAFESESGQVNLGNIRGQDYVNISFTILKL